MRRKTSPMCAAAHSAANVTSKRKYGCLKEKGMVERPTVYNSLRFRVGDGKVLRNRAETERVRVREVAPGHGLEP